MENKQQPNAIDLEKAVIGAILLDSPSLSTVIEILKTNEKAFYSLAHQTIYAACIELYAANEPVDLLTINQKLKEKKQLKSIGGAHYLTQLTEQVASSANIESHARILQQKYVRRQAMRLASNLETAGQDELKDPLKILETLYGHLDTLSEWLFTKKPKTFKNYLNSLLKDIEEGIKGIPCSIERLKDKINDYHKSDLIIIAARPGMGKTAYVTHEALQIAKKRIPVGIFSIEMSAAKIVGRMAANEFSIDANKIAENKLTSEEKTEFKSQKNKIEDLPIYINDTSGITLLELKIQAKKWKRENDIKAIFVDYLQLIRSGLHKGNREQEVTYIAEGLKGIAKELELPVIALCQLSRAVESRGGMRRPMLSDLRESGGIEQAADIVIFLLRPEYYNINEWEDGQPTMNEIELSIAKYRNGTIGRCITGIDLQYMRFKDRYNIEIDGNNF